MTTPEAGRNLPSITVQFCSPDRIYQPLAPIRIRSHISIPSDSGIRAIERSVLWYTEGKGEEDLGMHHFERLTDRAAVAAAVNDGIFMARLPRSPLSYEGLIVKIRWCVRIRVFFESGRDFVSEHVFDLGQIPAAATHPAT